MGTGILTTQIERLTQRANASGMHFHTVSSLKLLTQNQEFMDITDMVFWPDKHQKKSQPKCEK